MKIKRYVGTLILAWCVASEGSAQEYVDRLLKDLQGIACPVDYSALLSLGELHDDTNRINTIMKILEDRKSIHARSDVDYFVKTEIVCSALHLLDEYDLPSVNGLILRLNDQENWEKKERALLAFMSAKRDIHYDANIEYLLESLITYEGDLRSPTNKEVAWTITDVCNCVSYLGDLFLWKGDVRILNALFVHSSILYGYPAEYLSTKLVNIFLKRPIEVITALAKNSDRIMNDVANSILFGIRNESLYEGIDAICRKPPDALDDRGKKFIALITAKMDALHRQGGHDPVRRDQ